MKKLLPLILLLIGSGAGVGAGIYLRPTPEPDANSVAEKPARVAEEEENQGGIEYAKLSNPFVVPIVKNRVVASLVVLALSLEV
ncbi:MAG: flagellar basal body-associated protein FliL, partial [Sulfitobacter sp.]